MRRKRLWKQFLNRTLRNENYSNWIFKLSELVYYMIRPTKKRIHEMDYNVEEISQKRDWKYKRDAKKQRG